MCFWFYQAQSPFLTVTGVCGTPLLVTGPPWGLFPLALCDAATDNMLCNPWDASSPKVLRAGCGHALLVPSLGAVTRDAAGRMWDSEKQPFTRQISWARRISLGSAHLSLASGLQGRDTSQRLIR